MNNLKIIRKKNNLTQGAVAKELGITPQAYAHYEAERRNIVPEQLIKLSEYYNVSIDYLLGREYDFNAPNAPKLTPYQRELLKAASKLTIEEQYKVLGYAQAMEK